MFGKGGMKKLLEPQATVSNSVFMATTTNITIDDLCGQLGENSVMITTLDFENDTRTDEIFDIDVWEKRKHGGSDKERRVKSRIHERPISEFSPASTGPMNRNWPVPSPPLPTSQPLPQPDPPHTAQPSVSPGPSQSAQPSLSPSPSQTARQPSFPLVHSLPP